MDRLPLVPDPEADELPPLPLLLPEALEPPVPLPEPVLPDEPPEPLVEEPLPLEPLPLLAELSLEPLPLPPPLPVLPLLPELPELPELELPWAEPEPTLDEGEDAPDVPVDPIDPLLPWVLLPLPLSELLLLLPPDAPSCC